MMSHVLLYEPDQEKVSQLLFLLNLADIRCTVAGTIEEAYNWLSTDHQKVIIFDLFLLDSHNGDEMERKLLARISNFTTVPILYIEQEATPLPEYLRDETVTCHSHNLLSCLHKCLMAAQK